MNRVSVQDTEPPLSTQARALAACLAVASILLLCSSALAESGRAVPAGLLQKAWTQGTVRVMVELGAAGTVPEGHLSGHAAVAAQRGRIASDQTAIRSALRGIPHRMLREFKTVPYVGLEVDYDALRVLDAVPGLVTRVHEDILLRPHLAQSGPLIKAPDAWAAGWDGSGQVLAIIDTGVDKSHPFLAGKVVEEACFDSSGLSTCANGLTSDTGAGAAAPCTFADICWHGTHVAGIAAGNGPSFDGIARGAGLIAIRVFHLETDPGVCAPDPTPCARAAWMDIIAALEHVYELRETYSIAAANMSLGADGSAVPCDGIMPDMDLAIGQLRSAGTATVVSAGNQGFVDQISFPACISSAISVGATTDGSGGSAPDLVWGSSNSASFLSLLAPGFLITSSTPGTAFATAEGTSMAAAHVSGAWAFAKQALPTASVSDVLAGLQNTGRQITDVNGVTTSRIAATVLQFSASAYNVAESVGSATITVTRSGAMFGPHFAPLTVDYATSAGTAIAGQDYTATFGTLLFNQGEISKTFAVPITNDTSMDGARTVNLRLTNPGGGALLGARDTAILTIGDNDVAGSIQFSASAYSVSEQAGTATISVNRSRGSAGNVTVQYATSDGTAHASVDYQSVSGTITFESSGPGATTQTFTIPIPDNGLPDGNRTVSLTLHTPGGGASLGAQRTAVLTIVDDEIALQFSQAVYSVRERSRHATITVTRSGPAVPVGVTYTVLPGSATPGADYGGTSTGVLSFAAKQTTRMFTVPIVNDRLAEGPEAFLLQLSNPTGGAILGPRQTAVLTIVDDDPAGAVKFAATDYTTPDADGMATITLTRTGGTGEGASIWFATGAGGTAIPGTHYQPISPTKLVFPGNQRTATFQVQILGNTLAGDGNRTVELLLSDPGGGATLGTPNRALLTITNDDVAGALSFVTPAVSVSESEPVKTVTVRRTGGIAGNVTVQIVATDGTASSGPITAYRAPRRSPSGLTTRRRRSTMIRAE